MTTIEHPVEDYLHQIAGGMYALDTFEGRFSRDDWRFRSYEEAVLALGQPFVAAPLPKGLRRRTPKQCFMNAYRLADRRPELQYVEGYAVSEHGFPVQHAWAINRFSGQVVDVTWEHPEKASYYGIPFPDFMLVRKIALRHEVFGILGNDYLLGAPLLRHGTFLPPTE